MPLLGCFVTPHPPIIVPEVGGPELVNVEITVKAMQAAGKEMKRLDPETVVLLSPHSPLAHSQMGVSLASAYKGSLAFFRAPKVTVEAAGDVGLAKAIMGEAAARGIPTLATASEAEIVDLDHGAMVPLYYLLKGLGHQVMMVLLSFSYLGLEEHIRFGEAIGRVLMAAPSRVAYVASADLSHRLIPGAPAGYDPRATEFDHAVADTFERGDWDSLLSIDAELVQIAGECGYRSLAVLSGVVGAAQTQGASTQNHLLSYEGPFGVGYMVGTVEIVTPGKLAEVN